MCVTCGCSDHSRPRVTDLETGATIALDEDHDITITTSHDHHHDHHHITITTHDTTCGHTGGRRSRWRRRSSPATTGWRSGTAAGWLEREIVALNLVSSPGAGKTTLLERTIRDLAGELPISVVEGDQETLNDAERIRATGCRVVQINTGTGCHLDASMVARGLEQLDPPRTRSSWSRTSATWSAPPSSTSASAPRSSSPRSPKAKTSRSSIRTCSVPAHSWS